MKTLTITTGTALDEYDIDLSTLDLSDFTTMEDSTFYKNFTRLISIRLPLSMIDKLKAIAEQRKIPYQKLIKLYINEGISK